MKKKNLDAKRFGIDDGDAVAERGPDGGMDARQTSDGDGRRRQFQQPIIGQIPFAVGAATPEYRHLTVG